MVSPAVPRASPARYFGLGKHRQPGKNCRASTEPPPRSTACASGSVEPVPDFLKGLEIATVWPECIVLEGNRRGMDARPKHRRGDCQRLKTTTSRVSC